MLFLLARIAEQVPHLSMLLVVTARPDFRALWSSVPGATVLTLNRLGSHSAGGAAKELDDFSPIRSSGNTTRRNEGQPGPSSVPPGGYQAPSHSAQVEDQGTLGSELDVDCRPIPDVSSVTAMMRSRQGQPADWTSAIARSTNYRTSCSAASRASLSVDRTLTRQPHRHLADRPLQTIQNAICPYHLETRCGWYHQEHVARRPLS